jgi:hypothetical protein
MVDEGNKWKASNFGDDGGDGTVRACKQKQTAYVQCNIVARSYNLFRHGNATVRSVRFVELRYVV